VRANPQVALGAAYLAHLDGNHEGALRLLSEAGLDPARSAGEARGRSLVAQFLAAEEMETGDAAAAQKWLALALEAGGEAPLAVPFLLEMTAIAHERLGPAEARAVRAEACRRGVQQACGQVGQRGQSAAGAAGGDRSRIAPGTQAAPRNAPRLPVRRRRPPGGPGA
jgi:hypothetical protein